jgi:hypothetical protein
MVVAALLAVFTAACCPQIHAQTAALPQVAELSSTADIGLPGSGSFPGGGAASAFAFGSAVAMSGDGNTMVVGAGAGGFITIDDGTLFAPHSSSYHIDFGAISIFVKQGNGWTQAAVISAPDGTQGWASFGAQTGFGVSVAVNYDGSVIAAGGPAADSNDMNCGLCVNGFDGNGGGAAYVYVRPAVGVWTDNLPYSAKLTNSDGHFDDRVGSSVAISNDGTIVVVGAPSFGFGALGGIAIGEAYLFVQPPGGWGVQNQLHETVQIHNPDSNQLEFGTTVAISGDGRVAVITSSGTPVAHIYNEPPGGWQTSVGNSITYLQPSDGAPHQDFGRSVAMNGDGTLIVIGAPDLDPSFDPGQSKAYVYNDAYGWSATSPNTEAQQLTNASLGCSEFGESVSITADGATILVGDPNATAPVNGHCTTSTDLPLGTGTAYIFSQAPCSALCPIPYYVGTGQATASDASPGNLFGAAVAMSSAGDELLVGAPYLPHAFASLTASSPSSGKAYVFTQAPLAALSTSGLNFGSKAVGTTSAAQKVTLTNNGSKPLSITAEGIDPGFRFQGGAPNCLPRTPIAPGGSCDEYIVFAPTSAGSVTGTLSFQDNSGNVPGTQQTVSLSGAGVLASTTTTITAVTPSPAVVGQTVTVYFSVGWGTNTFNPSGSVSVSANTGQSCMGLAVVDNCTLSFPTYGTRTLTAIYAGDNHFNGSTSTSVNLNVGDFSISASPASLSIPIGASGSSQITIGSLGGFNFPVSLGVSGMPAGVSATLSPSRVTPPSGGSATPSTLSVNLGPSVTPTTLTVTSSGTYGSLSHSAPVSVSVVASPSSTTNVINQILKAGCINNSGVATAFNSKLSAAQSAIGAGNPQLAVNILDALLYQLQAQSGKHITTSCTIGGVTFNAAAALISDVQSMIIGLKLPPNPVFGNVVNSTGAAVPGAIIGIVNSSGRTIASSTTDASGFYFFANTGVFSIGSSYTVKITSFPLPYKTCTPASQNFTWQGTLVNVGNFVVN